MTNEATLIGDRERLREVILRWMSLVGTSGFLEETGRILERGAPVAMAPLTEAQWTYYATVNALRSALGIEQADRPEPTVEMIRLAAATITEQAKTLGKINKRLDEVEDNTLTKGNVAALRKALRRFTKRSDADLDTLNANGVADGLLVILNDPTETCEVAASAVELLRVALLAHAKDTNPHDTATGFVRQAAEVIAKHVKQREQVASIIEASAAPLITTDKFTGHPIGCEAHFAGIRFYCHKTHKREYADLKQTFVTVDVYTTTDLDVEAIAALRGCAERGVAAKLHAPAATGIAAWATVCELASGAFKGEDALFTFMLHATEEEAQELARNRNGHQGHADAARADLVKASNGLRSRVGLFPDGDLLTLEDLIKACNSIDEMRFVVTPSTILTDAETEQNTLSLVRGGTVISTYKGGPPAGGPRTEEALKALVAIGLAETWIDGNNICYGSKASRRVNAPPIVDESMPVGPMRSAPVPLVADDPRAMVRALIAEHGSYGKPCDHGSIDRFVATTYGFPLHEPTKILVALNELEAQAPTDLKGYGFTDATMLSPVPSNAARSHVATCLAYAGLLHDLRQALQRSLNGLAISAKYNAEKSSDMLAYWTAELARMPIPATRPAS